MITEYEQDVKVCTDVLKLEGVILYPTDTIWGIGCDATSEPAIDKIFKIKQTNCIQTFETPSKFHPNLSQRL